ncbi:MAG: hypothetical protein AABZ17_16255 [Nitrospirota bacterium]
MPPSDLVQGHYIASPQECVRTSRKEKGVGNIFLYAGGDEWREQRLRMGKAHQAESILGQSAEQRAAEAKKSTE